MRKPIAAVQVDLGPLTVVCDDGTVWRLIEAIERQWEEVLPRIPGTAADEHDQVSNGRTSR